MTKHLLAIAFLILIIVIIVGFLLKGSPLLTDIANIAQIIEGAVAIVLLLIAADIREAMKARHLEGIRYIKSLIGSEEASDRRKWVYQELKKESWPLPAEDQKKALAICRDFDHIGFLCRKGLVPVDLVVETYNRNIVDMWDRLERFIIQWRQETRDKDYFWEFEWLANKAKVVKRQFDTK
jgi:hypothetical protein